MPPIGSASAISVEYKTLGKLFGREGSDWRIHDRIRSKTDTGREIEKFIVATRDGRRVVHFDITDVLASPDPQQVQEIVDGVMRRQTERFTTVVLSEGAFLMLFKIIEEIGAQLKIKHFDAEAVSQRMIHTVASHELGTGEDIPLTLSVAEWVNVMSIARTVEAPNLRGQELTNDLISYIEGSLKGIGPG